MAKSSRTGRRNGTVTVIEARVHRNSARNARLAFVLAAIVAGGLSIVVASVWLSPILSLLVGIGTAAVAGLVAWTAVRVWPIVRVIWWWLGELAAALTIAVTWSLLATHTPLPVRAGVIAAIVAVLLVPAIRRPMVAVVWCFIVRHRLRSCFAQFIVANQSGSLPLILIARPTPVGERVWIYLRPGLSVNELQNRADKIAVACHASTVIVDRASSRTAALVRVDIKRREVLGALVGTPLADMVAPISPAPSLREREPIRDARALDLGDMPEPTPAKPAPTASPSSTRSTSPIPAIAETTAVIPRPKSAPASAKKVPASVSAGEDLSDWID
jgi:hypothetical protein